MSLDGTVVFCGGPIQRCFVGDGFDAAMARLVASVVEALEGCHATVLSAHIAEGFARIRTTSAEVTRRDHAWSQQCDAYVALLPTDALGTALPSAGTAMEMGWVSARGVPIVTAWDPRNASGYSHLVRGLGSVARVRYVDIEAVRSDPALICRLVAAELDGSLDLTVFGARASVPAAPEGL